MSRFVIDASAASEYLLRTPLGLKVATAIKDASRIAPDLIDVEVLSVLRGAVIRREISEQRALLAIEDLVDWSIDRLVVPGKCFEARIVDRKLERHGAAHSTIKKSGLIGLGRQLESPVGRRPRRVLHKIRARHRDAAANLGDFYQLRGLVRVLHRFAADLCAGSLLEPGAHFYRLAGCIHQLGLIPGAEFVRAVLQVHGRQHRVEGAADL